MCDYCEEEQRVKEGREAVAIKKYICACQVYMLL